MRKTDEAKATERRDRTDSGDIHRFPGTGHSNRAVQAFRNGERSDLSFLVCDLLTITCLCMANARVDIRVPSTGVGPLRN
jgi:hypothetical protein